MKKILLSTAILGSLILGLTSPAISAKADPGTRYATCTNVKCKSYGSITPHDGVLGGGYNCRICQNHWI